jgi:predicted membrane metal-binding protein
MKLETLCIAALLCFVLFKLFISSHRQALVSIILVCSLAYYWYYDKDMFGTCCFLAAAFVLNLTSTQPDIGVFIICILCISVIMNRDAFKDHLVVTLDTLNPLGPVVAPATRLV